MAGSIHAKKGRSYERSLALAYDHRKCHNIGMRLALKLHPDSRCEAVTHIDVDVARLRPGNLLLHYFVTGKLSDLVLPPVAAPARGDELWLHTCFEAFVRLVPGEAYVEFNFASSRQWAAYRFNFYRSERLVASEIGAPRIDVRSNGTSAELQASLELDRLLPSDAAWRLGLSAVIEETSGRKSYWALAHPPGKPDFHHSDCFALELPAVVRP
ncbi:MAG: DOMON-like domain-containing protein [Rhizomicrobium sp.]